MLHTLTNHIMQIPEAIKSSKNTNRGNKKCVWKGIWHSTIEWHVIKLISNT